MQLKTKRIDLSCLLILEWSADSLARLRKAKGLSITAPPILTESRKQH